MATIKKRDIVRKIADELRVPQTTVVGVIQRFLDSCVAELVRGNRLEFRDFGVLNVVTRKTRVARNPKTGAPVQVPERKVVVFKMGKHLKQALRQ